MRRHKKSLGKYEHPAQSILIDTELSTHVLLTRTGLDVAVLVLHRGTSAGHGGALALRSGAGSSSGAVSFGAALRTPGPGVPRRPAGAARPSDQRGPKQLLHKVYRQKTE